MQVEIKIDSAYTEPKVILMTDSMTDELQHLLLFCNFCYHLCSHLDHTIPDCQADRQENE